MALTVASRQVALLVALAYGFHPGAIVASTTLLSEGLFGSLCVFALFFLSQSLSRDSLPQSLAGGVFLGLAALTRSIGAIFPLLVLIAILMTRRNKRWLAHAIVVLSTAILVLIPWVIRSSLLARSFVLVQGPSFALNFYYPTRLDWNQRDQAAIWASFTTDDPCGKCSGSAKTPVEIAAVSRFCFQEALRNIRRAPIRYMFLRLRAFPQLFLTSFDSFTGINESFETGLKNRHLGRVMVKLILLVAFAAMPFSLAALSIRIATRDVVIGLCAVVCGFTLLIHIPMWIEYRYWQPVVPLLMVMAARGAESAALMAGKIAVAWRAAGDISEPPI